MEQFGVPIGILSGIFAIFILLKIIGALLGEFLFENIEGILLGVNIASIIISIILGFATIYLSAFISAKRASKVNPMYLLRNSEGIKIKHNKLKVPKIIQKVFKTGGVLAYKNLKRSKKKYRTTVISIAVSVCIFITMSVYINNMFDFSANYYKDYGYNMSIYANDEQASKVVSLDNIDEYFLLYSEENYDCIKIYDKSKIEDEDSYLHTYIDEDKNGNQYIGLDIKGFDDNTFKKYAKNIGVDYEKVKTSGILIDNYKLYKEESKSSENKRTYNYNTRRYYNWKNR